MKAIVVALGLAVLTGVPERAAARGDDGPKTVALIAQHDLTPATKPKIDVMLAADTDNLTKHDFAKRGDVGGRGAFPALNPNGTPLNWRVKTGEKHGLCQIYAS